MSGRRLYPIGTVIKAPDRQRWEFCRVRRTGPGIGMLPACTRCGRATGGALWRTLTASGYPRREHQRCDARGCRPGGVISQHDGATFEKAEA